MNASQVNTIFNYLRETLHLGKALGLIWKSSPRWTLARGLLIFVQEGLPLIVIYLNKILIDVISKQIKTGQENIDYQSFLTPIIAIIFVSLLITLFNSLGNIIKKFQSKLVIEYVNDILHSKAIEMDLEYYEDPEYYNMLARATKQSASRCNSLIERLVESSRNLLGLTTIGGILVLFDWRLPLLILITVIPRIYIRFKMTKKVYEWEQKRTGTQRLANYYGRLMTNDSYVKEIRIFDLGHLFKERFLKLKKRLIREELNISLEWAKINVFTESVSVLVIWGVYGFIAYQAFQGKLTLGDLVMYHQFFQRAYGSLWKIFGSLSGLYEDNLYLNNFYEFLSLQPKMKEPLNPCQIPKQIQKGFNFHNVSFQYPHSYRSALKEINLQIRPGEVIALVGENGSGKTTLIKLLCRLYDPTKGKITLDGVDLKDFSVRELRRQFSVIFQDYVKYHLSVKENIWFGNIDYSLDNPKINEVARYSGIDEVIQKFPQKYETILGKQLQKGEELSIGQWQKLVIARACLRDSQLIILDEPTSALDPKAEAQIFQKFRELLQGRSAILITHRLSTVKMADYIYVLKDGNLIEEGTHKSLIADSGYYAHLFETQAKNYRE
ncbi:ABC transporter ATP-binding protein [Crocosphaera sp.]|uniref:ABC transporter ATP-binding protein n=1 Tax=Crocosphaera sp. TaxID=2729996 RepID=UPI0026290D15|nr:ABC transporter ATP-binding protein [Crocosphaera sp.]MDJ0581310.1 ABC transporter ATP-binding protein [Crocosphaera sp.]